ncbi:DUF4998 domain-containing protein [Sphingobacterium hotanense]|uniref:DUF4998 domain-containing protein n=1 Tax=Sphingobacterium hotanense TaxID=649196 RepID=UPI0021A28DFB|nr:DUF4998 domain-containing protein [Sphingobacterium hotanense]MCT1524888.1 DUF4998 domain-containing protein [Sphingobacterium hotanense]
MKKLIYILGAIFSFLQVGCDNADDLLNQYVKDGPIVYAARIADINVKSGFNKVAVVVVPAEDVNKSFFMLRWNTAAGSRDSLKVDYTESNYHEEFGGYFATLEMPDIEGNILIEAWNVDTFGNKSLMTDKGGYVYGDNYINTLLPSTVRFAQDNGVINFDNRVGAVDNLVSYEQNDGTFTKEELVVRTLTMVNPKKGGLVRSKTRYLINANDIDTLITPNYLETVIP